MSYIDPSVYVIGSIAYDDLETPSGSRNDLLGGSAVYFSIAGSIFSKIGIIGTVGNDFNEKEIFLLNQKNIDTSKIEKKKEGSTFRWKGNYSKDFEDPITISTSLGVFEEFSPKIDKQVEDSSYIFLANISPDIQHDIANNLTNINKIVGLDTMNHWIIEMKESLLRVMNNVDIFFINKGEAFLLSNKKSIQESAKYIIENGPKLCIIKDGKNGSYLYSIKGEEFYCPTYDIDKVVDPTGAGDSFAGGFFGYISKIERPTIEDFKNAMIYGSAIASFTIEGFGTESLFNMNFESLSDRFEKIKSKKDLGKK
jgi:sugar/nucleoside kinase (ribokinase family)